MKTQLMILAVLFCSLTLNAQRYDLGSTLVPTTSEFEFLGTSSKTGVSTYRYKKVISDLLFNRKIGDITVGVRNGVIVTTIYNMVPNRDDVGVPADILDLLNKNLPHPFQAVNGIYGLNIDNESMSLARISNFLTFNKDRIMLMNSVKQSVLISTKK